MRSRLLVSLLTVLAAACGDPLVTSTTRGDPLFSVKGTVTQGLLQAPPASDQEVGVLWLNLLDDNSTVLVEATPADAIGTALPASFDVSVLRAPADRMLGTALISYGPDGSTQQPVDRNRVAFGVVVVAPQGTFAALPASVSLGDFISGSSATPGALLSSFTYVSPYTVRYVKDAAAEGISISDINGVTSPLADFTIFNVDAWAGGIANAACRDRKLGEGWGTAAVKDCITQGKAADPNGNSAEIENQCLYTWFQSQASVVDAACGPERDYAATDFRNALRLGPTDQVTLPLGVGDIRNALALGGFIFLG
jgi:hypothetical protein